MRSRSLRDWLAAGPFTLAMSSGFFGFYAHAGFLRALTEAGFAPSRVTGSSAGALVGGCFAAGLDPESISSTLLALQREDFWDPAPGPGLLRGRRFRQRLGELLPAASFEGCRIPLEVSAFDVVDRSTKVLGRGELAPSIAASCAVPVMFHPVWINGRPFLDGGLKDRPGIASVSPGARVLYHHLSSRSPWRRRGSSSLQVPRQPGLVGLVIDGLPRVNPYRLDAGEKALELAYRATGRALDERISNRVVRLPA